LTPFFWRHWRSAAEAPLVGCTVFAALPVVVVFLAGGAPVVVVLLLGELVVVVAVLGCGAVAVVALVPVDPGVVAGALALALVPEPFDELPQAPIASPPDTSRSAAVTAQTRLLIG
jgi:hypothetical protein